MPVAIQDIEAIVSQQNAWRRTKTINLIASENAQSEAVLRVQNSDFMARYAEGHPNENGKINRFYQGHKYIDQLEIMAREEIKALFQAKQADVRPISGNAANTAVAIGYLRGGDSIIVNKVADGGHISHEAIGIFGRRIQLRGQLIKLDSNNPVRVFHFPTTPDGYHIDVQKTIELIEQVSPKMLVLGKSLFLFPEPVKELASVCREKGIPILFDGAHILGLIAGGYFQDPLGEGATWLTGSTHKTFPGPQRGVIFSNVQNEDDMKKFWNPVDRGIFPGSSSNHHLYSLPALLVATREMKQHAKAYAGQTIRNAQALAKALDELGESVEARDFGYTQSHTIALRFSGSANGQSIAQKLEENDIIVNKNILPGDTDAIHPSGIRIGTPEMTRYGMTEEQMGELAQLIHAVIQGTQVQEQVHQLRARFTTMHYV